jgi:hypothetical protein
LQSFPKTQVFKDFEKKTGSGLILQSHDAMHEPLKNIRGFEQLEQLLELGPRQFKQDISQLYKTDGFNDRSS